MLLRPIYIWSTLLLVLLWAASCSKTASVAKSRQELIRKYPAEQLREDFDAMRSVMENFHPSLYWYTPKDSMDLLFNAYRAAIKDSMTQQQFGFSIIAPVTTAIRCGHTSFSFSKNYSQGLRNVRLPSFPLFLKIYGDTMIVTGNLNRKDSVLKRGTQITSIDGYKTADLSKIMFRFMPTDGYAENINYIRLSNSFPYYHRNIFGLKKNYQIGYIDSLGQPAQISVPVFEPVVDSSRKRTDSLRASAPRPKKPSRKDKLNDIRSLQYVAPGDTIPSDKDIPGGTAIMTVNSFDGNANFSGFFKRSFRLMDQKKAENLIIDIRSNGGGKVNNYTKLASYIRPTKFKVADSAYAVRKGFAGHGKMFSMRTLNALALGIFTSKRSDGHYHFNYWENHYFKPKKKNFFSGNVFVLISGPTFSASTLFAHTVKGLPNVTLVGEETGGGHHGNNGLMIPNVTLPNTGMRIRMPMFRLVQYQHPPKDGRGVVPDVYVGPTSEAIIKGIDLKMQKAMELAAARVKD